MLELRKRAANSPTTEAAIAIIRYLYPQPVVSGMSVSNNKMKKKKKKKKSSSGNEHHPTDGGANPESELPTEPNEDDDGDADEDDDEEDGSRTGFLLLNTINLLSSTDEQVIEIMCASNLPSTLVKCLYLFFDLPKVPGEVINDGDTDDHGTRRRSTTNTPPSELENRELVQKVFVQVLIRVCSYGVVSEELAKKDDLGKQRLTMLEIQSKFKSKSGSIQISTV